MENARKTWPSLWKGPARDPGPRPSQSTSASQLSTTPAALTSAPSTSSQPPRPGEEAAVDERNWVNTAFLNGSHRQHVGKLGELLGSYEEERQAEEARMVRRRMAEAAAEAMFEPEEEEEDEEDTEDQGDAVEDEHLAFLEAKEDFQRTIKERFIYGLLEVNNLFPFLSHSFLVFTNIFPYSVGKLRSRRLG